MTNLLVVLRHALTVISHLFRPLRQLNHAQQYLDINNEQIMLIKNELDYVSAIIVKLNNEASLIAANITKQENLAMGALSQGDDTLAYAIAEVIAGKENEQSCLHKQLTIMQASHLQLTQQLTLSIKLKRSI